MGTLAALALPGDAPRLPALPHPADPEFQCGVCYAHVHRGGRGYGSEVSEGTLKRLRALGVTWVSITPFGYQRDVRSSRLLHRGDRSMRDSALVRELRTIRSLGMRSMMKPHVWAGDFYDGRWSGDIRMESAAEWDDWFSSYEELILHFAEIAAIGGADALCIGTELGGTTEAHPERWRSLIAKVRSVYRGPITYAANWHDEYERIPFWDALDWIGVNAYFELTTSRTPTEDEVARAWGPIAARMGRLSSRWRRPILFTEVGFRSADHPATETHAWPERRPGALPNLEAQRACYAGTFRALWGKTWLRGLYWWKYYSAPGREEREDADFTFAGKPAEEVLAEYYRSAPSPDRSGQPALDKVGRGTDDPEQGSSSTRPLRLGPGDP